MEIAIRPLDTPALCREAEEIQLVVWGKDDGREIVPGNLLIAAQRHGGLLLGAFGAHGRLVGITFSIIGQAHDGQREHYSHIAAVLPEYQSQGIGARLKLAQREHVLAQGIARISWTYDPLESRNARLNIRKLGAVCNSYTHDYYGAMRDALNAGIPSDRFTVAWQLRSARVEGRIGAAGAAPPPPLAALLGAGATLLNASQNAELPRPAAHTLPPAGATLLVAFPARYQRIKAADHALALAWRLHTRALFDAAFAAGYTVTDVLTEDALSYYVLEAAR